MSALDTLGAHQIVTAIADTAARWSDADFPPRVRALDAIVERTGYSTPVVEYALDRLFESLDAPGLEATIAGELGSLQALDEFVDRRGRPRARALPLGNVCIVSSRTTIGVALLPAVFALCAKCDVLVKDREDHLIAAFFRTLAEEDDAFAHAAMAKAWEGDDDSAGLHAFAAVVAFGGDDTLAKIRARCAPLARFIGFGAKASAGYVTRDALTDAQKARELAHAAARDLLLYETEGCLSLHALFIERGGALGSEDFASLLAAAVERAAVEFPAARREPGVQARIGSARALAAFQSATGTGTVFSQGSATHLIVAEPPRSQPPFFLPHSLGVLGVDSPAEAVEYLEAHGIGLEALATDRARPDVVQLAIATGASRIARFGELQHPLASGYHGGRPRVADFVRWITDET